jgi:hypothetical protein
MANIRKIGWGVTTENPPNAPTGSLKAAPALPTADDVPYP